MVSGYTVRHEQHHACSVFKKEDIQIVFSFKQAAPSQSQQIKNIEANVFQWF